MSSGRKSANFSHTLASSVELSLVEIIIQREYNVQLECEQRENPLMASKIMYGWIVLVNIRDSFLKNVTVFKR